MTSALFSRALWTKTRFVLRKKRSSKSIASCVPEILRRLKPLRISSAACSSIRASTISAAWPLEVQYQARLDTPLQNRTLESPDFVAAIKYLLKLRKNIASWTTSTTSVIAAFARSANFLKTSSASVWSAWNAPSRKDERVSGNVHGDAPRPRQRQAGHGRDREFFGSSQLSQSWTRPTRSAKSRTSAVCPLLDRRSFA